MQPRLSRLVRTTLRKTRLALLTTIAAKRDTLKRNVVVYIGTRNLS
jgi:hypothetical protein